MRFYNISYDIYTFEHYNSHKVRLVFKCNVTDKCSSVYSGLLFLNFDLEIVRRMKSKKDKKLN